MAAIVSKNGSGNRPLARSGRTEIMRDLDTRPETTED